MLAVLGIVLLVILALAFEYIVIPYAVVIVLGIFGFSVSFWEALLGTVVVRWLAVLFRRKK